jgi:hypothetical protein
MAAQALPSISAADDDRRRTGSAIDVGRTANLLISDKSGVDSSVPLVKAEIDDAYNASSK